MPVKMPAKPGYDPIKIQPAPAPGQEKAEDFNLRIQQERNIAARAAKK